MHRPASSVVVSGLAPGVVADLSQGITAGTVSLQACFTRHHHWGQQNPIVLLATHVAGHGGEGRLCAAATN